MLLISLLMAGIVFSCGPWWALRNINEAVATNNVERWPQLVEHDNFESYTRQVLSGVIKVKMFAHFTHQPKAAMDEFQHNMKAMPQAVQQLITPKGFSHLLCGELFIEPLAKPAGNTDCWAMDGHLAWQSPVQAKVTFTNPKTHRQSQLTLARTGLFSWQAVALELPVDSMMGQLGIAKPAQPKGPAA